MWCLVGKQDRSWISYPELQMEEALFCKGWEEVKKRKELLRSVGTIEKEQQRGFVADLPAPRRLAMTTDKDPKGFKMSRKCWGFTVRFNQTQPWFFSFDFFMVC